MRWNITLFTRNKFTAKCGHHTGTTVLHTTLLTANSCANFFSPFPITVYTHTHIYTLSPPPPLRCCDSFVTKMNSSSALQPKQVIWLPRPQIKLVWFNFRFGLLLQPYIKGDIFHYTAKPQASRQWWPTPSIGRHHGSIMAFTQYCCGSSEASGGVGGIVGLVIHRATQPRTLQPTYLACLDCWKLSCDTTLAGLSAQELRGHWCRVRFSFHLKTIWYHQQAPQSHVAGEPMTEITWLNEEQQICA